MDSDKTRLLFGHVPADFDPDDPDERGILLAEEFGSDEDEDADSSAMFLQAMRELVANQIVEEDPPEVWATARRLRALGMGRERVIGQLLLGLLPRFVEMFSTSNPFDAVAYRDALDRLPLPGPEALPGTMVSLVQAHPALDLGELEQRAAEEVGIDLEREAFQRIVEEVVDGLTDPEGPLVLLSGDRVVAPATMNAGVVLTHRVTESEIETGWLSVGVDLVGFARLEEPLVMSSGETLHPMSAEVGHRAWRGPDGWLDRFAPGTVLAVRSRAPEGENVAVTTEAVEDPDDEAPPTVVSIEALPADPEWDEAMVASVRQAYEDEYESFELPVSCEYLYLELFLAHPGFFAEARPPLSSLAEAAGLQLRGGFLAHESEVWSTGESFQRAASVMQRLDVVAEDDAAEGVLAVLDAFFEGSWTADVLRPSLRALRDPEALSVASDELFGTDDDAERAARVAEFAQRLIDGVRQPADKAVAHWLHAVARERLGDAIRAEREVMEAVRAAPTWLPAVDRAAWYRSDRGDLEGAVRLWRRLGPGPGENPDLDLLESISSAAVGPSQRLGRNDPCWCGSGRKYKTCHLDRPVELSLQARTRWLRRKVIAYMERRGGSVGELLWHLAAVRAGDDADVEDIVAATADSAVIDLALEEGRWFERFLADRGPLLPQDEARLAASWGAVRRTLYRVGETWPEPPTLRDLRTGEAVQMDGQQSPLPLEPGSVVCTRVAPTPEGHMVMGFVLRVPAGGEDALREILAERSPEVLAAWVGALEHGPYPVTREGEPLVFCDAQLEIDDVDRAVAFLDARFGRDDEPGLDEVRWIELGELEPGDDVVRTKITLAGTRLAVETMSEARLDRVLGLLSEELTGLRTVSVDRTPFDEALSRWRGHDGDPPFDDFVPDPSVVEEMQDRLERRWCDEEVPALGGQTPRRAAADPALREQLERLLQDFERLERDADAYPTSFTMRPWRLRELLDLDAF